MSKTLSNKHANNTRLNDAQSELACAYLRCVAAKANIVFNENHKSADDIGFDSFLTLRSSSGIYRGIGKPYFIQIKSCSSTDGSQFSEDLKNVTYKIGKKFFEKVKNFGAPVMLIVLRLPPRFDHLTESEILNSWLDINENALMLAKCAYFKIIEYEDTADKVVIPKTNLLTPENLLSAIKIDRNLV